MGHELVAANLVPLAGRRDLRRTESVDAQADRRPPRHRILYKLHLLAVVGKQERARCFQALFGDDIHVHLHAKLRAYRAIRPDPAYHFRPRPIAQAEMKLRTCDWLLLDEQSGAYFDFSTDTEGVDPLIAHRLHGMWTDDLPVIILRGLINSLYRRSVG